MLAEELRALQIALSGILTTHDELHRLDARGFIEEFDLKRFVRITPKAGSTWPCNSGSEKRNALPGDGDLTLSVTPQKTDGTGPCTSRSRSQFSPPSRRRPR